MNARCGRFIGIDTIIIYRIPWPPTLSLPSYTNTCPPPPPPTRLLARKPKSKPKTYSPYSSPSPSPPSTTSSPPAPSQDPDRYSRKALPPTPCPRLLASLSVDTTARTPANNTAENSTARICLAPGLPGTARRGPRRRRSRT